MKLKHSYKIFNNIQQRFALSKQVAAYKHHHNLPVYAPEIEYKILIELKTLAVALQLDEKSVAKFIILLMHISVKLQENLIKYWKSHPNINLEIQDLHKTLRPQIKSVTMQTLQEIKLAIPELTTKNKNQLDKMVASQITCPDVSRKSKSQLLNALLNIKELK